MTYTKAGYYESRSYKKLVDFMARFKNSEHVDFSVVYYDKRRKLFYVYCSINVQIHLVEAFDLLMALSKGTKHVTFTPFANIYEFNEERDFNTHQYNKSRGTAKKHYILPC